MKVLIHAKGQKFDSSGASDLSRFDFSSKTAEVNGFAVDFKASMPLRSSLVPGYPSVCRRTRQARRILLVSSRRDCSQAGPSVIQLDAINVVSLKSVARGEAKQFAMHPEGHLAAIKPSGAIGILAVPGPSPLIHPLGVGGINQGVGSNAAVSGAEQDAHGGIIGLHRVSSGVSPQALVRRGGTLLPSDYTPSLRGGAL